MSICWFAVYYIKQRPKLIQLMSISAFAIFYKTTSKIDLDYVNFCAYYQTTSKINA